MLQLSVARNPENVVAVLICAIGTIYTTYSFFKPRNMRFFPLSSWIVLFFVLSNLTVPLIVKGLEFESLDYKLKFPYLTFGYALATSVTLIAAHWVYANVPGILKVRLRITLSALEPAGFFRLPSEFQLWMMGFLGCAAHAVMIASGDVVESKSVFVKLCVSLVPFTYAPFLMPFAFLVGDQKRPLKSNLLIPIYFVFTVAIAMGANGRIGIVLPIVTAGMCWLIGYFTLRLPNSFRKTKTLSIILLAFVALIPVFTNMALAMSAARTEKEGASPLKLVQLSFQYFGDQKALSQVLLDTASDDETWDETYVHNPILARFVNTKFQDLGFTDIHNLSGSDRDQYVAFLQDKFVALLPAPVLERIGISADKSDRLNGTTADYLHSLNTGIGFGGHRTSGLLPQGVFIFGVFFLPAIFCASIVLFIITDSFCIVRTNRIPAEPGSLEKPKVMQSVLLSPAILVSVWHIVYINVQFEMFTWLTVFVRDIPVQLILYLLILRFSNAFAFGNLLPQSSSKALQR